MSFGIRFGKSYHRRTRTKDQIEAAYNRANIRYAQGYLVDAYIQASRVVEIVPWHRGSRHLLLRLKDDFDEIGNVALQQELREQVEVHYERGLRYAKDDETLILARQEFEAILDLQPHHARAYLQVKRIGGRFRRLLDRSYPTAMPVPYFVKMVVTGLGCK